MLITVTQENFSQEVEAAKLPVLIDLWAPWCGYCRRLAPVLDRLSAKFEGKLIIGKINVDEQPKLAEKFDTSLIPTLYLYQNGQHGDKIVAPASQAQLEAWIAEQITL